MKKITLLAAISFCFLFTKLYAQVGIGTATPNAAALFHVDAGTNTTKGILITGAYNFSTGTVPNLGGGSRLMFYPGKAAFRAGFVDGTQWDDGNIGTGSTATGYSTTASGYYSVAMGIGNQATGNFSTALGRDNFASGDYATVLGANNIASGQYSTAMGHNAQASGIGSFTITDNSGTLNTVTDNQMRMRFAGGYVLYTNPIGNMGVYMLANGNAWSSLCDKNRKENFEPLNGEEILHKLSNIPFTSWNYKMQDPKIYRHYGIMAQDFNNAFGYDKYGSIGNDTTVNPIDMIGIDMAAIQALVKRTNELKIENEKLKNQLADQNRENENLHKSVAQLQTSFAEQQKLIGKRLTQLDALTIKQTVKEPVAIK